MNMIAAFAALCRYIADALDPAPKPVEVHPSLRLSLARKEYEAARKSHRGQRVAYAKFRAALHDKLRMELGL